MEPVLLGEIVVCFSDSLQFQRKCAVGSDLAVRDASCLVCHRRFEGEDNSWRMVVCPWVNECSL